VHVIGRICSDANEGKFNDKSVMLEGLRDQSAGERVYVDLSEIDSFSLFPGQV
jgi:DNA polymerase alpha subunit B